MSKFKFRYLIKCFRYKLGDFRYYLDVLRTSSGKTEYDLVNPNTFINVESIPNLILS